jgi:uncharacterized protein
MNIMSKQQTLVGIISDTHGLLRSEAFAALQGSAHILHAGDIGTPEILERLRTIAPVTAVRGNNDFGPWANGIPERVSVELGGVRFMIIHDLNELPLSERAGVDVIVSGHSHRPRAERMGTSWLVNPGSAGPRRFTLPITVAQACVTDGQVDVKIVILEGS